VIEAVFMFGAAAGLPASHGGEYLKRVKQLARYLTSALILRLVRFAFEVACSFLADTRIIHLIKYTCLRDRGLTVCVSSGRLVIPAFFANYLIEIAATFWARFARLLHAVFGGKNFTSAFIAII